jgi:hypothetical protein
MSDNNDPPEAATVGSAVASSTVRATLDSKLLMEMLRRFYEPLKEKNPNGLCWDGIIFRCGTLVRLDCTDHVPLTGFTNDDEFKRTFLNDFPSHRGISEETTLEENQKDFDWSQTSTQYPTQCAKAYGCLMHSGYPLPGGAGGDRTVHPWTRDDNMFITIFDHLGPCCFTLFDVKSMLDGATPPNYTKLIQVVDADTAERRRLDYMFPKPFAYIDHQMNIHVL